MCSYKTAPVSTTADPEVVVCIVDRDPQENGLAITFGTNFLNGNVLCRFCSFLDSVFTTYVVDFFWLKASASPRHGQKTEKKRGSLDFLKLQKKIPNADTNANMLLI